MESHLLQMRGLKHILHNRKTQLGQSHLLQMRGLKRIGSTLKQRLHSRIFYRCVD